MFGTTAPRRNAREGQTWPRPARRRASAAPVLVGLFESPCARTAARPLTGALVRGPYYRVRVILASCGGRAGISHRPVQSLFEKRVDPKNFRFRTAREKPRPARVAGWRARHPAAGGLPQFRWTLIKYSFTPLVPALFGAHFFQTHKVQPNLPNRQTPHLCKTSKPPRIQQFKRRCASRSSSRNTI